MFLSKNTLEESIIIMGLHIHLHTFPTLETERLILRQLAATDAQIAASFCPMKDDALLQSSSDDTARTSGKEY